MVTTAIRQYHHRIIKKVDKLVKLVQAEGQQPILINEIMYWFAFDSMGDFAFSMDFKMMENQEWHQVILLFRSALALLGPLSPAIWIPRLAFSFAPGLLWAKWWFQMLAFCDQCMERRMKQKLKDKDIASFFIEDHSTSTDQRRKMWLSGDTATLVVAGSDTNAPTLTHLFYFLARYPEHADRIYQELKSLDSVEDAVGLSKLSHLNGAINETMRLLPAVLTFGTRVTPPEGLTIAGTFIPGGTKICAPRYTIGRCALFSLAISSTMGDMQNITTCIVLTKLIVESAYDRPEEFIPERWYSQGELIRDRRAFAPFGVGK